MERTTIKNILSVDEPPGDVLVQGWVKTRRSSKSVTFVQVNDGSTLRDLQIVVDEASQDYALANSLTTGCSVSIVGKVVESQGKGQRYDDSSPGNNPDGRRRSRDLPPAEEATHSRVSPRDCPLEATHQHLRSNGPGSQRRRLRHPLLFPAARIPVHPDTDNYRQRCRGRRFHVQGHDAGPGQSSAQRGRRRHRRGLLRSAHFPLPSAVSWKPKSSPWPCPTSTPLAPPSGRRTRTPRVIWPNSGWSSPRWPSASWRVWRTWPRTS